jgi:glycosyltransferase involved in cell wall biosynthesis
MLIAINAHSIGTNNGGNQTYTENLIYALSKIDKKNEYIIYTNPGVTLELPSNYKITPLNIKNRWLRNMALVQRLKKDAPNIYHGQYFLLPLCKCNSIITVHDISFLSNPEWFTSKEKLMFKFFNASIKKAKKIIAVSDFTKQELIKYCGIVAKKISVIHNGVANIFKSSHDGDTLSKIKTKYSLPSDYLLYVGRINIRKNLSNLIEAFYIFKKNDPSNFKLVIAGNKEWGNKKLENTIYRLNLNNEVIFTGYVSHSDLPAIYKAAGLFIFPSFYEGFGLPVLEAMACGTPCITSNTSAFMEIASDASLKINPYNIKEMAEAMQRLIRDQNLRNALIEKGLKQIEKFDWLDTAQKTLNIYKEIVE